MRISSIIYFLDHFKRGKNIVIFCCCKRTNSCDVFFLFKNIHMLLNTSKISIILPQVAHDVPTISCLIYDLFALHLLKRGKKNPGN